MPIRFNPTSGWPQNGRAFNHVVVQPEGKTLHITGQVAWDRDGNLVGYGDCEAQLRMCFYNVEQILVSVGGKLEDLVSLTIFFLNPNDLPIIQKIRSEKLRASSAPVSTIVQTPGLVVPELLVELVPIAVVPLDRYRDPEW